MIWQQFFDWTGCALGLTGAFLLASNTRVSRFGWLAFLAANFATIAFALNIDAHGLLLQQMGFMATSCLGVYRTWLEPCLRVRASPVTPGKA